MQAQADHAWRYWWRQGGFGLLEAAARRHTRERIARERELARGQQVRFLASGVCSGVRVAEATIVRRRHAPVVGLCEGGLQVVIEGWAGSSGGRKTVEARAQLRKRRRGVEPDDSDRWAVERVLDARHEQCGAGMAVQYLVQ